MSEEIAVAEQSAPTSTTNEESSWLQESAKPLPPNDALGGKQPVTTKDPAGQTVPAEKPLEQNTVVDPNVPQEYKIKSWDGTEKTVTLDWMQGYFQTKGNEQLAKLVTPENAPLLQHIAERTMKLNNAYQRAQLVEPEYNQYKQSVQTYFDTVAQDPAAGFNKILSDLGMDEKAQEAIIEKMAIALIEKREMTPEARAAMEAQRERDRIMQEANEYKSQIEQMKVQQEAQQLAPAYQQSITNALTSVGFEVSPNVWDAMIEAVYQKFGNQKEPITQEQFNKVAQQLALTAMSYKQQTQQAPSPAPVKKVITNKPVVNKQQAPKVNSDFMTEDDWMKSQGIKSR